ncbi:MAG: class I SAM-dependent methyltransferase [Acidimicrobiales bacterium]
MASEVWGEEEASEYDVTAAAMFDPSVLGPAVDYLVELASGGPVLEFAAGTGRVALEISARGVAVSGIELSPHMARQMLAKPGADQVPIVVGDMTTTHVEGTFTLVYLVWNSIMNVTTQDGQAAVFENAAAHLGPGGHFVLEVEVPRPREHVFAMEDDHVGIDTVDDAVNQIMTSHHWFEVDGTLRRRSGRFRYVWPSELDLMARLAGMKLVDRWAGWRREAFTADSPSHVAVYQKID